MIHHGIFNIGQWYFLVLLYFSSELVYCDIRVKCDVLTQPHVFQTNDKARCQVEDSEERIAHERRRLQGWQGGSHKQCHAATAVHHQPHQQEVEKKSIGSAVEPSQPVDGHTVYQCKNTVLWKLTEDLKETNFNIQSQHNNTNNNNNKICILLTVI